MKIQFTKGKTKRHPSEITLGEFLEVAKIINPQSVEFLSGWILEKDADLVKLIPTNSYGEFYFLISWSSASEEYIFITQCRGKDWDDPSFGECMKIAAYLDSIGIEYRVKN